MKIYLQERAKIKALFVVLFCFVTLQIPNLLENQYIEEKDL
jgi:hypothetical protein